MAAWSYQQNWVTSPCSHVVVLSCVNHHSRNFLNNATNSIAFFFPTGYQLVMIAQSTPLWHHFQVCICFHTTNSVCYSYRPLPLTGYCTRSNSCFWHMMQHYPQQHADHKSLDYKAEVSVNNTPPQKTPHKGLQMPSLNESISSSLVEECGCDDLWPEPRTNKATKHQLKGNQWHLTDQSL